MRICFFFFLISFSLSSYAQISCHKWQEQSDEKLMITIDNELQIMFKEENSWYISEHYGLQPIDSYELDYKEKCLLFLQETKKEDVYCACKLMIN